MRSRRRDGDDPRRTGGAAGGGLTATGGTDDGNHRDQDDQLPRRGSHITSVAQAGPIGRLREPTRERPKPATREGRPPRSKTQTRGHPTLRGAGVSASSPAAHG